MATATGRGPHTLVLYGASSRADEVLRRVVRDAGRRVTVLALAFHESESGCCDTRSVLWNEVCRDLAREDLARAARALDSGHTVDLEVLVCGGRHPADAVAREALDREADEIVLADPAATGLGRRERRRLQRRSTVPVSG